MKFTASEKMEIICTVENSRLSISATLRELHISRSTFYEWYRRYEHGGPDALENRHRAPRKYWNAISPKEKKKVLSVARKYPEKSSRELAFELTDNHGFFISESSVYRILKASGLIAAPVYTVKTADDKFRHPTTRINQLWQTDFTYFKIAGWGWYYLSTVMDDFSRYILSWKLCSTMKAEDVKDTLDIAIRKTGKKNVKVKHGVRLLSDNGPCYISKDLREYLEAVNILHTRSRPYHPMTQGKIERYHRSMKNILLLDNYYSPEELEKRIAEWVEYYNNYRYHESIGNVTPTAKYYGRADDIMRKRYELKLKTIRMRKRRNLKKIG